MPKYAHFDPTVPGPSPVIGWYDTDAASYPQMPPDAALLLLSATDWTAHLTDLFWAVSDGALVPYTPPPPALTLDQRTDAMLAEQLARGIVLTSTGNPALNATYALDAVSTAQIFQIGLFASQFGEFPSGDATVLYPDSTGMPHSFSVEQFVAFLRVVAPLVSVLNTQAGIMRNGGIPSWPGHAATIV